MLRALIWDVDGTLAETERDGHRLAFNLAFEEYGLSWYWNEQRYGELLQVTGGRERLLFDMDTRDDSPAHGADRNELAAALHAGKNRHYARLVADGVVTLRAGVRELMQDCAQEGLPMAIATTTSRSNVEALLSAHFGGAGLRRFAAILCAEDAPAKKPDPLVYRLCLQRLGVSASEVVAREDSPAGVAACAALGVPVVVTRSHYFACDEVQGALAVGPGLGEAHGWMPAAAWHGRIALEQIRAWLAESRDRC